LWQIYVDGNNETYVGLRMKCPMLHYNKKKSFVLGLLQTHNLVANSLLTDNSLRSFFSCCRKTFYEIGRN
jgi:hypothetical protein